MPTDPKMKELPPAEIRARSAKAISARIAAVRKYYGVGQVALGKHLGVGQGTISAWESGEARYSIGLDSANRFCDYFNVTLDFIFRGDHRAVDDRDMIKAILGGKPPK